MDDLFADLHGTPHLPYGTGVGIDVNGDGLTDIVEYVTNHDGYYQTMIDVATGHVVIIDPHGIVQDAQFGNPDDPTYPTDPLYPGNPVPPIDPLHPTDPLYPVEPSNPVPRRDCKQNGVTPS